MATRYEEQLWQGDVATMAMLKEIRETGRELVAPHEKVRFVGIDGDHEAPGALKLAITTESGEIEVPMQRWALQQACGRVEPVDDETGKRSTRQAVPFAYIDKLVTAGGFKLAADNLNFWAAKTAERVSMIRVWAKGVRAWVSDRFRPIDTISRSPRSSRSRRPAPSRSARSSPMSASSTFRRSAAM